MRLITYKKDGKAQVGVRQNNQLVSIDKLDSKLPNSILKLLTENKLPYLAKKLESYQGESTPLKDIDYLPPIPRPGKIICIGRNYAAHAAEGGAAVPDYPEIFYRGATSLTAHKGAIIRPACSNYLDYEGEFAFIIGEKCRHATAENALDFVAGYSLFNDASIRNYQRFSSQWTIGKNFDNTGAFGPELVTADELPSGLKGCTLTTTLNGQLMQTGQVDDLVFPVGKLIELLSECMTLEPGDVVITGTPSGVGYARKPPVYLQPEDTIEVTIEGLGKLVNSVRDEIQLG